MTLPVVSACKGSYLPSNVKGAQLTKRANALRIAKELDWYNNGNMYVNGIYKPCP